MPHESSFDVSTARCFLNKLIIPQYEEFIKDNSSSRHALVTVILLYHMYEWANQKQPKFTIESFKSTYPDYPELAKLFEISRKIANGTKHFKPRIRTKVQTGFSSAFSDGFERPLNVIDIDGDKYSVVYQFETDATSSPVSGSIPKRTRSALIPASSSAMNRKYSSSEVKKGKRSSKVSC